MENVVVALIGLIGVVAGAALTAAFQHRKISADTDKTIAETNEQIRKTVRELMGDMQKKITDLNARLQEVEDKNGDLEDWAERLCCQIKDMGEIPVKFIVHPRRRRTDQHPDHPHGMSK